MLIEREPRLEWIGLEMITTGIQPRGIQEQGVQRLAESMQENGFLPQFPIVVSTIDEGYRLLAGHHRVEAARRVSCATAPALVYNGLTSDEEWYLAVTTNRAHEAATLPTFVDDAELVWKLYDTGKKVEAIADIMGWKAISQVSQYNALRKIVSEGWRLIFTTFQEKTISDEDGVVKENFTTVRSSPSPFTERILREIVSLSHKQQLELIKLLIKDPDAKSEFRGKAERHRARNAMKEEATHTLWAVSKDLLARAHEEIDKGYLDKEWLVEKVPGSGFRRLMQQLLDEHAEKQNYRVYCGDCREIADTLEPESVDVILTDPPYGGDALEDYATLATIAARVLKPGGSLVVMCGQYYLPEIVTLLANGLKYYWCLCYLTPGAHATRVWQRDINTFWKPVLWFVKEPYVGGKWLGDVAKSPTNGDDKRFHKWGQSEAGMEELIERISQPGDLLCDPFMGAGTTGVAAIRLARKFVGIDRDQEACTTAEARLAEATTKRAFHEAKEGK